MNQEVTRYLSMHDLDEEEADLLVEWVNSGHSVYTNPDEQYDDYGEELPYMKWYWRKQDPRPIWNRKRELTEAMTLSAAPLKGIALVKYLKWACQVLRDEIILYRRFLAMHEEGVPAFERYRDESIHNSY